ncbi:MAG TPA: AarF/UbiB family protein [Rhodocyclaceae bacterium]|nr:AarF/UbiB family protein [Rhodocyclaceae bacterium]
MATTINNSKRSNLPHATPRLLKIMRVLARHKCLGILRGKKHWPKPKEVREIFEELGLIFLKFGQVLALRRDLLPADYADELAQLHDEVPGLDIAAIRATIEEELDAPMAALFSDFKETPLAAATIAQVHEATTIDGRHVAVKVQRPGLETVIATDIAVLNLLVVLAEKLFPRLRGLELPLAVSEFETSLHRETDFGREGRAIVLFRSALTEDPDVWIPDVLSAYSGRTVLTMEFSAGERVDLYARKHPEAMPHTISTLVRLMLQSIFESGLFHADPHPGNVFVLPDGRLSLLDFGMTGDLDESMRDSLVLLLEAVVKRDARAAKEAYLEMATASEKVNRATLLLDIKAVLYEIHRSDLNEVSIGAAFDSLLRAGSRNGVHNPSEFFLLTRAFVVLESMIRLLDPRHNYIESFRDEVSRLTSLQFSPERIKQKTIKLGRDTERFIGDAPADIRRVLRRIASGQLGRLQLPALEALGGRISRNLERLNGAIAAAALVIGGAMLVSNPLVSWHYMLGEFMIAGGVIGALVIYIGALRHDRGRR